ncbi:MAG: Phosphoglycolate phosphatase [Syntrophus sp. PtaB.Bin001]|nr:MAG: Phosphoglycolate phosphatase [Syntrophus sp. PtaB.Bin001]
MKESTRLFKAFVFDFDGTLAELNLDFNFMRNSIIALSGQYGIRSEGLHDFLILELIDIVRDLISKNDPAKAVRFFNEAHHLIKEIEMEAANQGALLEGTLLLLTTLKNKGIPVGIISRNCHSALVRVFPNIADYCSVVLSRDKTIHVKPHSGHLVQALRCLDTSPAKAVMVGDHPLDIHLGRQVGTYTIGVLTGYTQADSLFASGADLVLNRAFEILEILF